MQSGHSSHDFGGLAATGAFLLLLVIACAALPLLVSP